MNAVEETEKFGAEEISNAQVYPQRNALRFDVAIYENEVPDFAERELERLYESVYCTIARFNIYAEARNASTYVARVGHTIHCLILFRLEGCLVRVINQQIKLSDQDLACFADTVFTRYPAATRIAFYAIDTGLTQLHRPFQRYQTLEENVLVLPSTREQYTARLNQNLLKRLQSGERKLQRDHPGHRFRILRRTEVTEEILRQVLALASARMAAKQKEAYIRDEDVAKILQLIQVYGFVGTLTIDGVIRGGNIFYGVGRRYFMHVIAHDPDFDKYMLGHLVQYSAACHCIDLGGSECWLMGGGRENKSRFRAYPKYLENIDIYRSRMYYLLDARRVMGGALRRFVRKSKEDLYQLAGTDSRTGRAAARLLAISRSLKQGRRRNAGSKA